MRLQRGLLTSPWAEKKKKIGELYRGTDMTKKETEIFQQSQKKKEPMGARPSYLAKRRKSPINLRDEREKKGDLPPLLKGGERETGETD